MTARDILVTNALPYANGPIHLGHLLGYIQADVWVRFQRMQGHTVHYVCADDAHGTSIMLSAEKAGISAEQLIAGVQQEHHRDHDAARQQRMPVRLQATSEAALEEIDPLLERRRRP